ncbi:tryptophan synthase subunit beta [Candidatus Vidania fulgoroideae]|uniref:tryptophan synthase n=1 Tax=Candidatus Vidania fulgoroideorum TaxID=881286 RepID=A0A974XDW5_9PROT|nr:tryptophan synthase subunit beta [Candidatus Vidania fulgoroideae]
MNKHYNVPNNKGFFGKFGGRFVPELLKIKLKKLERHYNKLLKHGFQKYFYNEIKQITTRPTIISEAKNINNKFKKGKLYFKREDLNFTGSHKINNAFGQALLAKELGYKTVIAETGAGQHGLAVATASRILGLQCEIFMGRKDIQAQKENYKKIKKLGAKIIKTNHGLEEAVNSAIKHWTTNINTKYYLLGSAVGPHPYPLIVRNFQKIIGQECLKTHTHFNTIIACIGGGSNAIGLFFKYIKHNNNTQKLAVEACGKNKHNSIFRNPKISILHGCRTYVLTNSHGGTKNKHTISSGLNYPAIGPEHAYLHNKKLVKYSSATNKEALQAFKLTIQTEGIIPSYESSHAISKAIKIIKTTNKKVLVNLSGNGSKDI